MTDTMIQFIDDPAVGDVCRHSLSNELVIIMKIKNEYVYYLPMTNGSPDEKIYLQPILNFRAWYIKE